jgi:hypothetical protein
MADAGRTYVHRGRVTRAGGCEWARSFELRPLYAGDSVAASSSATFSQASDGTVYYAAVNARSPAITNDTARQYSFAAVYASTDSGTTFTYRGNLGRWTGEKLMGVTGAARARPGWPRDSLGFLPTVPSQPACDWMQVARQPLG